MRKCDISSLPTQHLNFLFLLFFHFGMWSVVTVRVFKGILIAFILDGCDRGYNACRVFVFSNRKLLKL